MCPLWPGLFVRARPMFLKSASRTVSSSSSSSSRSRCVCVLTGYEDAAHEHVCVCRLHVFPPPPSSSPRCRGPSTQSRAHTSSLRSRSSLTPWWPGLHALSLTPSSAVACHCYSRFTSWRTVSRKDARNVAHREPQPSRRQRPVTAAFTASIFTYTCVELHAQMTFAKTRSGHRARSRSTP